MCMCVWVCYLHPLSAAFSIFPIVEAKQQLRAETVIGRLNKTRSHRLTLMHMLHTRKYHWPTTECCQSHNVHRLIAAWKKGVNVGFCAGVRQKETKTHLRSLTICRGWSDGWWEKYTTAFCILFECSRKEKKNSSAMQQLIDTCKHVSNSSPLSLCCLSFQACPNAPAAFFHFSHWPIWDQTRAKQELFCFWFSQLEVAWSFYLCKGTVCKVSVCVWGGRMDPRTIKVRTGLLSALLCMSA